VFQSLDRLRRLGYPLRLARVRLAHRLERVALVALGIAAGAAMLAATLGGSLIAQDRSLERATGRIAPADRAVRALWFGIPAQDAPRRRLDRWATDALRPFGEPVRSMVYRETSVDGVLFDLAAVDGASRFVQLSSGRLPRTCTPRRCEVVQLAGTGPLPKGLNLVRVGRARLISALPFGNVLTRETANALIRAAVSYHTPPTPPFLLAEGVAETAELPVLDFQYRSLTWVAPLDPGRVHPWSAGSFAGAVERTRGELGVHSAQFDVDAPTAAVAAALEHSRVAGRRLLLVGGEAAALLLAFTLLAATRLRRDTEAAWRRLTWFGARRWQLVALTTVESALVALAGAATGWGVGSAVAAFAARRAASDAGAVLAHGPLGGSGLLAASGIALAATLVLVAALRIRALEVGGLTLTPIDALALGALAAVAIGFSRGSADAASFVEGGGTGTFLLLAPALIAFVAAVAAARLLAPVLRLTERRLRGAPVPARLAALSLARSPGHAAVAVAFVVVSLGFAVFAQSYRATLSTGQREQADFEAPVDAIAREDLTKLVPVLDAAPLVAYSRIGIASQVIRLSGGFPGVRRPFTLLGVQPSELRHLRGAALGKYAQPLSFDAPLQGVHVSTRALTLSLSLRGDPITVAAEVALKRGGFAHVPLGVASSGTSTLRAVLPRDAKLVSGLTFGVTDSGLHGSANGGLGAQPIDTGTLELLSPAFRDWTGVNGITAMRSGFRYVVAAGTTARLRARQPTDDHPVPVLATHDVAAQAGADGRLSVAVEGQPLVVRVVATIPRFPTARGDAVVGDEVALATALNAAAPGSARPNEVWLRDADLPALRRPPFDALAVTTHEAVAARLHSDPLSRGVLLVLAGAALVALALALVGLALGLVADLRDEQGELFDLESQGAAPATLRSHLRLRAAAVGVAGALGGLLLGLVLAVLVVDLVTLAADAAQPEPPLHLVLGWPVGLVGLALLIALGAVLAVTLTRRAFRAQAVGRWTEVGT
jgi:hypothetical protein